MYRESVYADHENPQAYEQAGGMFIYDNLIGASRPISRDELNEIIASQTFKRRLVGGIHEHRTELAVAALTGAAVLGALAVARFCKRRSP